MSRQIDNESVIVHDHNQVELVESVVDQLDLINTIIGKAELASEPLILTHEIDKSYIYEI